MADEYQDYVTDTINPAIQNEISAYYPKLSIKVLYGTTDSHLKALVKKIEPTVKVFQNHKESSAQFIPNKTGDICIVNLAKPEEQPDLYSELYEDETNKMIFDFIAWHEVGHCIQYHNINMAGGITSEHKLFAYRAELFADLYGYTKVIQTYGPDGEGVADIMNDVRSVYMLFTDYEHSTNISYPNYKEAIRKLANNNSNKFKAIQELIHDIEPDERYISGVWKFVAQQKKKHKIKLNSFERELLKDKSIKPIFTKLDGFILKEYKSILKP